jgi:hypothetical protein
LCAKIARRGLPRKTKALVQINNWWRGADN